MGKEIPADQIEEIALWLVSFPESNVLLFMTPVDFTQNIE